MPSLVLDNLLALTLGNKRLFGGNPKGTTIFHASINFEYEFIFFPRKIAVVVSSTVGKFVLQLREWKTVSRQVEAGNSFGDRPGTLIYSRSDFSGFSRSSTRYSREGFLNLSECDESPMKYAIAYTAGFIKGRLRAQSTSVSSGLSVLKNSSIQTARS